jgi:glycogen operon protein
MGDDDWADPGCASLGLFLSGRGLDDVDADNRPLVDDDFVLLFNGSADDIEFTVPAFLEAPPAWQIVVHTAQPRTTSSAQAGDVIKVSRQSLVVLRRAYAPNNT